MADTDYRVTLRPLKDSVPAAVRMRRALKLLGRAFGLRAVRVEELPPDTPPAAPGGPPAAPETQGRNGPDDGRGTRQRGRQAPSGAGE
jgi:hypothetical protein